MKITKYEHACLVIEEKGRKLVIDPGVFSSSYNDYENIAAVVVTHVHPDHLDIEKLKAILRANAGVPVYTVQAVTNSIKESISTLNIVTGGDKVQIEPFNLEFFGGQHAVIHQTIPITDNIGVLVNDILYYPGDSLILPHKPIHTLAAPAVAPWMRVAEIMDFISAAKPKQTFPTHNAILSDMGIGIYYPYLEIACKSVASIFLPLSPLDSIVTD